MDIHSIQEQPRMPSIFLPVEHIDVSALYQRPIAYEQLAHSHPSLIHPDCLLTLIDDHLLISDPHTLPLQPAAALPLSFDLKFEVVRQHPTEITSTKIGIRLFYDENRSFTFYSHEPLTI